MTHTTANPTDRASNDARIGFEILEMLFSHFILRRRIGFTSGDRIGNLVTNKLISLLTDDIILRLCKVGDDAKGVVSFRKVEKCCSEPVAKRAKERHLKDRINAFCTPLQILKKHRDARIAHSSSQDRSYLEPPTGMYDALREAVEIWDSLTGTVNAYSLEGIDLRSILFATP